MFKKYGNDYHQHSIVMIKVIIMKCTFTLCRLAHKTVHKALCLHSREIMNIHVRIKNCSILPKQTASTHAHTHRKVIANSRKNKIKYKA